MAQYKMIALAAALGGIALSGVGCSSTPSHANPQYHDNHLSVEDVRADDTPWLYAQTRTYEEVVSDGSRAVDYRMRSITDDFQTIFFMDRHTQLSNAPFYVPPAY